MSKNEWHHAPVHKLSEKGAYLITAGTYLKQHHFSSPWLLDYLQDATFSFAREYAWNLDAWTFFSNHYHLVGLSDTPENLPDFLKKLHSQTAIEVKRRTGIDADHVWYNYWDKHLSFQKSYLARLKYVHTNPVHHGLVGDATNYRWCSANWFLQNADRSFYKTVYSFGLDRINVFDDFEPETNGEGATAVARQG
jgi:putative transposase